MPARVEKPLLNNNQLFNLSQGLAAAAATRQAIKERAPSGHAATADAAATAPPPAKKRAGGEGLASRPPPTMVHEVLTPPGYDDAAAEDGLDAAVHGELVF